VSLNRDSLCLGERIMAYLPHCVDIADEVREVSIQDCVESSRVALPAMTHLFCAM
jgi:hypothetical protein